MESRSRNPRSNAVLRLFWGIAPTPGLHSRIASWRSEVESPLPTARWVQPGDAHLTLAFLGGRPDSELDWILAAGRAAAVRQKAFPLRTADLGGFPSSRPSRVLWLGVEPNTTLASLAAALQEAMVPFGYRPELTPFHPHLTLARFRTPIRLPLLPGIPATPFSVDAIHLFQSDPHAVGPKYRSLGTAPLSPSSPPAL